MKPIKVTMQAFGPYRSKTVVDFAKLSENKLFLITGSTGGGKTTILDAMCFALYCRATGGLRDWKDMRNISAKDDIDTFVEYEFVLGQDRYRFVRTLNVHIKRKSSEKELRSEHECYKMENGEWEQILCGSETSVNKYAEKLLGLDCEQFSKVMVLPQGEFRKLLLASSKEKSDIFEKLFSMQRWKAIQEKIKCQAKSLKSQLDKVISESELVLSRYNLGTNQELLQMQDKYIIELKDIDKEILRLSEGKKELEQDLNGLNLLAEKKKIYIGSKLILDGLEKELLAAKAKRDESASLEKQIPVLELAVKEDEKNVLSLTEALENYEKIRLIEKAESNASVSADKLLKRINDLDDSLKKGKGCIEQWREEVNEFPIINAYFILRQKEKALSELKLKHSIAKEQVDKKRIEFALISDRLEVLEKEYSSDISAKLSQNLIDGKPCPVCGSTKHPNPAKYRRIEGVSIEKELKYIQEKAKSLQKELNDLQVSERALHNSVEKSYEECLIQSRICRGYEEDEKVLTLSLEELEHRLQDIEKNKKNIPKGEQRLKCLNNEYESARKELENVQCELKTLQAQKSVLKIPNNVSSKEEAETKLKKVKSDIKNKTDAINKIRETVVRAQTDLEVFKNKNKDARSRLERDEKEYKVLESSFVGKNLKDLQTLKEDIQNQSDKILNLSQKKGSLSSALLVLKDDIRRLDALISMKASLDVKYSKTEKISAAIQGNVGPKIPIQNYVLGMLLDDVLSCANVHFALFSGNRYALSKKIGELSGNTKKGLDLEVFDAHNGGIREVNTLSGGELFLASMSLAFGLSDVVQSYSGGVRLDSIFIDEGFGSLDQETMDTAMMALGKIQERGRLIGIISHVSELKNRIPAKIEVIRLSNGENTIDIKA